VLYVLDEPTIGLHPTRQSPLLGHSSAARLGNTLDRGRADREVIGSADYLLDFGTGAGDQGANHGPGDAKQVLREKASLHGTVSVGKKAICGVRQTAAWRKRGQ